MDDNAMAESINGLYKARYIRYKLEKTVRSGTGHTHVGGLGIAIDDCWKGWAILLRQKQKADHASIGNDDLAA